MKSKTQKVLDALQNGEGITNASARKRWGHKRLSQSIYQLRERGFDIRIRHVPDPRGTRREVMEYYLC